MEHMNRDTLFLLKADFRDGADARKFYCPDCAFVEGVLKYFPHLCYHLDIQYVDFQRPRKGVVDMIGEQHQGCPVLVLNSHARPPEGIVLGQSQGHMFISGAKEIARYWHLQYGISASH
jgi:hypothetical protein